MYIYFLEFECKYLEDFKVLAELKQEISPLVLIDLLTFPSQSFYLPFTECSDSFTAPYAELKMDESYYPESLYQELISNYNISIFWLFKFVKPVKR